MTTVRTKSAAKGPAKLVQPIHFEDYSGVQFERLVFAALLRMDRWRSLEWYGQVGSDLGRDIWGIRENDALKGETVCVQCVNRDKLTAAKARRDIDKVVSSASGKPNVLRFVCRSSVSAGLRDETKKHANSKGIYNCEIWGGQEFEERIRSSCESLLKRFVEGVEFPDAAAGLRDFAEETKPVTDDEILALMARVFDRPAFTTHFGAESSLPAFKQAITDTIQAVNTGICQTRDGKEIRRIPSRHDLQDAVKKAELADIIRKLTELRSRFDALIRAGEIRPCGCSDKDCSIFMLSHQAVEEMNRLRSDILSDFRRIYPKFEVRPEW